MQRLFTLLTVLLCATLSAFAQGDSPYALFGYEGKVLRTPQERQQRMMLVVPNPDTTATVAKVGLDPAKQRYYLFDKQNQVIASDTLAATTVSRFLSVDPLAPKYPWYTPYQFAGNTPIQAIDLDGLEPYYGGQAYSGYDLFDNNRDGKVSKGERQGGNQALAFYGIAAIDMYLTRGWLARTFLASTLGDAIDYGEKSLSARKSGNTQAANYYSNQSKSSYTQFGVGLAFEGAAFGVRRVLSIPTIRSIARQYIGNSGIPASSIERAMESIDFSQPVYTTTFEAGTKFYRYSEIGTTAPKHFFSTETLFLPGEVGKNSIYRTPGKYIVEEFTLTKRTTGLESTVNTFDGQPGAKQVFSTQIQQNSTVRSGKTWADLGVE